MSKELGEFFGLVWGFFSVHLLTAMLSILFVIKILTTFFNCNAVQILGLFIFIGFAITKSEYGWKLLGDFFLLCFQYHQIIRPKVNVTCVQVKVKMVFFS